MTDHLRQDVRFALRQLRKHPGFTGATVFMLALGLCASVSIFAFVDAALIKPLPYRDPSRLVGVFETVAMFPQSNLSYYDYLDWKRLNTTLESLEAYQRRGFIITTADGAQPARGARVSDGFFRTLGVQPVLGRDFTAGEDLPSAPRTVLLTYSAWQTRYGGRSDVLGQTVTLDARPHTIVGVLPRGFHFTPVEPAEFWITLHADGGCDLRRGCHSLYGVARLKEGASVAAADADVKSIARALEQQYPDSNRGQGGTVDPLTNVIVGNVRPIVLVLLGGAALLLMIAGVNASSLLLVRSESRRREMAVRTALGASSTRLVRQFVVEAIVLVSLGTGLGLIAAQWATRALIALVPDYMLGSMAYLDGLGLNARVLTFAGLIAIVAVALFALAPMLRLPLSASRSGLTEGSRGSAGLTWRRLGAKLVVLELATAMVLLVGAGLLGQSLYRLLRVDIGLRPEGLVTVRLNAPRVPYTTNAQRVQLQREIVGRVGQLPGVQSVGLSTQTPFSGNGNTTWFRVEGRPWNGEHFEAPQREVTADYFKTLGATLVRGRYFSESEDQSKPRVAIINQSMARIYFPNEDPIGKRLLHIEGNATGSEIIGVVENIREGPLEVAVPPVLYLPFNQGGDNQFGVVARTAGGEETLLPAITNAIRDLDPGIVTTFAQTMRFRMVNSPSAYLQRSSAWLVGGFAALALLLGVVGLYGVVSYSVSQRRREIGVRMALGAQPSTVYRLILKEAGSLTIIGVAIGMACAVGAATLIRGMLFQVQVWDVPTLAGVATVLIVSALLASFLPARRAASVAPVEVLRAE